MDIKDIVNKPDTYEFSQDEMIFVISEYIKDRKGIEVKPRINTSFGQFVTMNELNIMNHLFNYALNWYKNQK